MRCNQRRRGRAGGDREHGSHGDRREGRIYSGEREREILGEASGVLLLLLRLQPRLPSSALCSGVLHCWPLDCAVPCSSFCYSVSLCFFFTAVKWDAIFCSANVICFLLPTNGCILFLVHLNNSTNMLLNLQGIITGGSLLSLLTSIGWSMSTRYNHKNKVGNPEMVFSLHGKVLILDDSAFKESTG